MARQASRGRRLLGRSAVSRRVCPPILMSSQRKINWLAPAITRSKPSIGTTNPGWTLRGQQAMLRTFTHINGGTMDPAEAKESEAPVQTSVLPVVRDWKRVSIASGASFIALALVFWFLFGNRLTTDDAQVDGYITTVSPRVSGDVVELRVKDNQEVQAGDPLVDIDPRDYQAAYDQAKAAYDVAVAEAQSAKVNSSLTRDTTASTIESSADESLVSQADLIRSRTVYQQSATALLDGAKANLDAKLATNERAQADLKRYRPLLLSDDVSHFQFDPVEAAARLAKSEFLPPDQQELNPHEAVDIAKAQATAAEHQLSRSEAELRQSKPQLKLVPIREAQYQTALATIEPAHAPEQQTH